MKTIATTTLRLLAAALICASVSACSAPVSGGNFPVYGSASTATQGTYSSGASSIMDY